MKIQIESLSRSHASADFDCGEPDLNEWLRRYARQNQSRHLSRTLVATDSGSSKVFGYCTISVTTVADSKSYRKGYVIPVLLIGRVAVELEAQGQGIGRLLLATALNLALEIDAKVGIQQVMITANNSSLARYYERFGFKVVDPESLTLALPINDLIKSAI